MVDTQGEKWKWHHNVSECQYHIQLTVSYRKKMFKESTEEVILNTMKGFKERYILDISRVGFDKDHVHLLCRFLPKYSIGKVVRLIKSITARELFKSVPGLKEDMWGGGFWSAGHYVSTVSPKGSKNIIEQYIKNQGRSAKQLKLFNV